MHDFYQKQKTSLSEKQKATWYVPICDHIIDVATSLNLNDKVEVQRNLNAANGIVDTQDIRKELKSYTTETTDFTFPTHITDLEFITNIRDRYIGEYIRQFSEFQIFNNDSETVMLRNQELNEYLKTIISDAILEYYNQMQANAQEGQMVEAPDLDIEAYTKTFLKGWIDKKTVDYQNRLNLLDSLTDADLKYIQAFYYWFSTEQVVSYRKVIGQYIHKEIINPVEYYRVPGNNIFIEDDSMGVRVNQIGFEELNIEHRHMLSDKDLAYITELIDKQQGNDYCVTPEMLSSRIVNSYDPKYLNQLTSESNNGTLKFGTNNKFTRYHVVFKTQKKIQLLDYYNAIGKVMQKEVDSEYVLDPTIGDISLKTEYVLQVLEMYRFGAKGVGIYTPPVEVQPQRSNVTNSSIVKLPYNGISGLLGDFKCNPIPRKIAPLQVLHKFYTYQQQRSISAYKNLLVIPEDLIEDTEEMSRVERLSSLKKDALLFISNDDNNANKLQGLKNVVMQGLEHYIEVLANLLDAIKRQAMDIASMNEQRYGDINTSAGKATTEYAITKATTASILLFEMFNKFRERDTLADIDASKVAWIDGYKGSYFDKKTGKVSYVDVDGEDHLSANIGIYSKNGILESEKKAKMADVAFSAAQNSDFEIAAEAIDATSIPQLKALIKEISDTNKAREEQQMKYVEDNKRQIAEIEESLRTAELDHDTEKYTYMEEMETKRLLLTLDVKKYEIDVLNSDGSVDSQKDLDRRRMAIEEQRLGLQESVANANKSKMAFDMNHKIEQLKLAKQKLTSKTK